MNISDLNHLEEIQDATEVIGGTGCYYSKHPKFDIDDILADIDDLIEKYKAEAESKVAEARKKAQGAKKSAKAKAYKASSKVKSYSKGDGVSAVKVSISVSSH